MTAQNGLVEQAQRGDAEAFDSLARMVGDRCLAIAVRILRDVRTSPDPPAWAREQLLTAEQALRTVTLDGAWAVGDEAPRGHLAPGTLGDVTILSGDVTAATPDEIRAMSVVATIVGGIAVHCADPQICSQLAD